MILNKSNTSDSLNVKIKINGSVPVENGYRSPLRCSQADVLS